MMKNIFGFGAIFVLMLVSLAVSAFAQPVISPPIGAQTVDEGQLLSFIVKTTPPDDLATDPVTFTLCNTAGGASCTLVASPLTIGLTSATLVNTSQTEALFEWTPDFTQADSFSIKISVNDADSNDSQIVSITVNDVAPTLSAGSLSLGGTSQERSNPLAEDEEDENINVTGVITITNSGGEDITNLVFSSITGLGKYSASFAGANSNSVDLSATTVLAGKTVTATLTIRVPENLDAVDSSQKETGFDVAQLTFTADRADGTTSINPLQITVRMQAENKLEIDEATIFFQDKSERVREDKNIDGIDPGEEIEIEFIVESKFNDRDQIDIKRIDLEVISTGDDDDLDVNEEEDVDDLGTEDKETVTVSFDVEEDAKKGKEDVTIILTGEDENGAKHGERWEITLEIEREDHEISIKSKDLNPSTVSCDASADLVVSLRNTGRDDEEDIFLRIHNPELNFQSNLAVADIDEDDESTHVVSIPIPEDLAPGKYRITIDTYYDTSKKSSTEAVFLTKLECSLLAAVDEPVVEADTQPVVVITPTAADEDIAAAITGDVIAPPVVDEVEESFVESTAFIALLILAYAVVIGGGAIVAIKLLRK